MNQNRSPLSLLIVEDDPDDRLLVKEAFEESETPGKLQFVEDGEELMERLQRDDLELPDLILLDLNMPRKDGREALRELKSDPNLRHIPIIVLTTSNSEMDVFHSYDLGASAYITKPVSFEGFLEVMRTLKHYWVDVVVLPPRYIGD